MKDDFKRELLFRKIVSQLFLFVLIFFSVLYYFGIKLATPVVILILAFIFIIILVRNIRKFSR